jgi:hypothetical protein
MIVLPITRFNDEILKFELYFIFMSQILFF